MNTLHRVGILTTKTNPLLPYLLKEWDKRADIELRLIVDEKGFSVKDSQIFLDRTEGAFPKVESASLLKSFSFVTVPNHNSPECIDYVQEEGIELLINAGTPRILGRELIRAPSIGILNVHPGLLPKYRGATCCEWSILNDDPVGVTAHFMNEQLDGGPIILSETLPVKKGQSYAAVRTALYRLAHRICIKAVKKVFEENLHPDNMRPQPAASVFKPMSNDLLRNVKEKLLKGQYAHAQ